MADQQEQIISKPQIHTENKPTGPVSGKLEPIEKAVPVKVIRKVGTSFTPSIKDALSGNKTEKNLAEDAPQTAYNEYENFSEPFTFEQLTAKWNEFLGQIADRPNLLSTLSNVPELSEGNKLILKIGNSVQEEDVRQIKPDLVAWLRKELRNSSIELVHIIEKVESVRNMFSDSEKLKMMIEKNPELMELKQRFNLDFKD
jgi:hypothetical protein